jgi:tetratricopeptide (TPR) repeat protein
VKRIGIIGLAGVLGLLLAVFSVYGLWLIRVAAAEVAFAESRYPEAQQRFLSAFSGWHLYLLPDALVAENQARVALNLVQTGYVLGQYQETLEFIQKDASMPSLLTTPQYHFWTANLTMARALETPDANIAEVLSRSREGYLRTLRQDPEYWDAKYNYEYVSMLLDRLQGDEAHSEEEMKLLLEKMRTDMPRRRKVLPPEKRK